MSQLIPVWRLREIRNIADSIVFRAACCPLATLTKVVEASLLKEGAHIRLVINPRLPIGEAEHFIQVLRNIDEVNGSKISLIVVTIYFNGNLTSKQSWRKIARAVATQLVEIAFFSEAANRQEIATEDQKKRIVKTFVNMVMRKRAFEYKLARPRFTVAMLRQIIEEPNYDFQRGSRELQKHIQRLLLPYLGPDGW